MVGTGRRRSGGRNRCCRRPYSPCRHCWTVRCADAEPSSMAIALHSSEQGTPFRPSPDLSLPARILSDRTFVFQWQQRRVHDSCGKVLRLRLRIYSAHPQNSRPEKRNISEPRLWLTGGAVGVGKGTLIEKLMKEFPNVFGFSVSHTTRAPRPGEQNGVAYHFTTQEAMLPMIKNNEFLESANVHGKKAHTFSSARFLIMPLYPVVTFDDDKQHVVTKIAVGHGAASHAAVLSGHQGISTVLQSRQSSRCVFHPDHIAFSPIAPNKRAARFPYARYKASVESSFIMPVCAAPRVYTER